jgi:2-polyprenyl-3-methyl-5-hydroxy-6-metoxy-1,4-benzoquinol methylase
MINESERLEKIATVSTYNKGTGITAQQYCCQIFTRYIKHGSILELGPAEGVMTDMLYPLYPANYTVVDGSSTFINQIKSRYPDISAIESIFENFSPSQLFDNILLGHVLEHVVDPVAILTLCKKWLRDDGVILTAVPNKNSIHRQAAVEMGLLSKVDDFSKKDNRYGHRRIFGWYDLLEVFSQAGLNILAKGGYWLKPLSDSQIESSWTDSMIEAFLKLGERYPDISGEIYVVASK